MANGSAEGPSAAPAPSFKGHLGQRFFLFLRQRSLNAMEGLLRQPRRMERLIGSQKPSADRMGQVLSLIDPDQLWGLLSGINHQWGA